MTSCKGGFGTAADLIPAKPPTTRVPQISGSSK